MRSDGHIERIVLVSGGFDPLHVGHLDLLEAAAQRGAVVVALNSDAWLERKKGRAFMPWAERRRILLALGCVRSVVAVDDRDGTVCASLRSLRPACFANGGDRGPGNSAAALAEEALCAELGIVALHDVGGRKRRSSSQLLLEAARALTELSADARRYRWLNAQDNFLAYLQHPSGEKTYRLKCGEPLDRWIDAAIDAAPGEKRD